MKNRPKKSEKILVVQKETNQKYLMEEQQYTIIERVESVIMSPKLEDLIMRFRNLSSIKEKYKLLKTYFKIYKKEKEIVEGLKIFAIYSSFSIVKQLDCWSIEENRKKIIAVVLGGNSFNKLQSNNGTRINLES